MAEDGTADEVDLVRAEMDTAIRDVLSKRGYLATSWALSVEVIELEDNKTYIWTMKPDGQALWTTLGLVAFHDQTARNAVD